MIHAILLASLMSVVGSNNKTGNIMTISGTWTRTPETMAIASGFCIADSSPTAKVTGSRARMTANIVMVMGPRPVQFGLDQPPFPVHMALNELNLPSVFE